MIRKNSNELELWYFDGGGVPVYRYNGTPFTGIVEEYDNGILYAEDEYINGFQEGWMRIYHTNGQLQIKVQKHNNMQVSGTYKEYDQDGILITWD